MCVLCFSHLSNTKVRNEFNDRVVRVHKLSNIFHSENVICIHRFVILIPRPRMYTLQ